MKYIIVVGDGMADYPIPSLADKTPLEYARTPIMDEMAKVSEIGLVQTIPDGMSPGSDTANLSVIGYDPEKYYSGRSPLEALSIGVDMKPTDVSFRCNIVTLSEKEDAYEEQTILDHSSGEISTKDAAVLLKAVKEELEPIYKDYHFYTGTSYRELAIWENGKVLPLTPPHDILGKVIGGYLPEDEALRSMMKASYDILKDHPINLRRKKQGLNPANSLWFWGAGTRPALSSFEEKYHRKGVMISAVDLLKGIAVGAGLKNISIKGATGGLETDYEGKAQAAVKALLMKGYDFAYIHVEAPDEMGHQGSLVRKIQAIEYLDYRVLRNLKMAFDASGEPVRILVLPDHPTPIAKRTHVSDPVPYMLYDSSRPIKNTCRYNEREAKAGGIYVAKGHTLIDHLFEE